LGLKGTDDQTILQLARAKNVPPIAEIRASEFIQGIKDTASKKFCFYTSNYKMGEDYLLGTNFDYKVVYRYKEKTSMREDTTRASNRFIENNVDAIFFVGGDGTARDIFQITKNLIPIIGIPAGVKMLSGIFCTTVHSAVRIFGNLINGKYERTLQEIIDVDEGKYRMDKLYLKVYGYALTFEDNENIQGSKQESTDQDIDNQERIAKYFIENIENGTYYILGPGLTVKAIPRILNQPYTLLGVDILLDRSVIKLDLNEEQVIDVIKNKRAKIVVSPLGGQGIIFGRGNQQISSKILRMVGKENIVILSTERKLASIKRSYLIADVNDYETKQILKGYFRILVDYNVEKVFRIES
jgi:predicted polyphosphate/ATP-dependent NAD kinase